MREQERLGFVTDVIQLLNESDSWTGRMHIQKFIYFAKTMLGIDVGYEFVLYQRGPYAFELDSDIRTLRSIGVIDIKPHPPYGPTYYRTTTATAYANLNPMAKQFSDNLLKLARFLGPKTAGELELLATTYYARSEGVWREDEIPGRVTALKPQFSEHEVLEAMAELDQLPKQLR